MKVHVRQIPQGSTLHLEGEESPERLELEESGAKPASPLSYSLDLGVSSGGIFATGSLSITVRLECVACLREFEKVLTVPDFAARLELEGREAVDLTPALREDILLVLPSHPRCDSDGSIKCPAKFQTVPAAPLHNEQTPQSIWTALDDWKPKNR